MRALHGFVEFYENTDNGENKIKVQGSELTEDNHQANTNTSASPCIFWNTETDIQICYQQVVLQLEIMDRQQQFQ